MKRFPWEDKLGKKGVSIFDDKTLTNFQRIRDKYQKDYIPFLDALVKRVGKEYSAGAKELRSSIDGIISDVDALGTGKVPADGFEGLADRLHENMENVDKAFKFYREEIEKNEGLRKKFEATEKKTDVSFRELETAHTKIEKAMTTELKPSETGFLAQMEKTAPKTYELGKGLLQGFAQATLGPFAGIGATVLGSGVDIYKTIRERQMEKKRRELSTALTPMAKEMKEPALERVAKKRGVGEPVEGGVYKGLGTPGLGGGIGMMAGPEEAAVSTGGRPGRGGVKEPGGPGKNISVVEGMFQFFNKRAYEARWTADVLEALKGKKEEPAKGGGGSGFLPAGLATLFGVGAAGLGAVLAGVLANKLDTFLHKVNPSFAKGSDIAKSLAIGPMGSVMNMVHPIEGPKMMAQAYADMTKSVMARLGAPLDKYEAAVNKLMDSMLALAEGPIKKIGDFLGGLFKGKGSEQSKEAGATVAKAGEVVAAKKAAGTPPTPVTIKPAPPAPKPQNVKVDLTKPDTGSRLEDVLGRFNSNLERLFAKLEGNKVLPPPVSQMMSKGTTDDARGTGDSALDALNYGSFGIYDR